MRKLVPVVAFLTIILSAGAADVIREELQRNLILGSDTMVVVVNRLTVPVGATIPLHTYSGDEQGGGGTQSQAKTLGGQIVDFPVGANLYFPQGEVHGGLTNVGDGPMGASTVSVVNAAEPFSKPAE